jgi:Ion channel
LGLKRCKGAHHGITWLLEQKYLILLAALLLTAFVEPLVAHWSARARIFAGAFFAAVDLGILLVVFNQRWERWLAFALVIPALACSIVRETLSDWASFAAIAYHYFAFLFLGFAVAVILMRIFHHQGTIRIDTVIGALCGYLLAAAAWANVYALVYLFRPEAFRIADVIAPHFSDWNLQRFFFSYFSVTTLTSLGYSDITPIDTLALSFSWIEVVFGQFYIAVVVAQLVGLKLAESIKTRGP